jgi:hypothetical protein
VGASSRRAVVTAVTTVEEEEELRTRGKVKGAKGRV